MRRYWRPALAALASAIAAGAASAQPACRDPMRFVLEPGGTIQASGEICSDTDETLRSFLQARGVLGREWPTIVRISSPGGIVRAAVASGRLLRIHRMSVEIVGPCMSACTYLAAGGVNRTVGPSGSVWVHQFYSTVDLPGPLAADRAQRTSAELSGYLEEMGVASGLFRLAARIPRSEMQIVSREQLAQWNFITANPPGPVARSPEPPRSVAQPAAERLRTGPAETPRPVPIPSPIPFARHLEAVPRQVPLVRRAGAAATPERTAQRPRMQGARRQAHPSSGTRRVMECDFRYNGSSFVRVCR